MANIAFSYMYRDASNWKQFETVILHGEMSEEDIDLIMACLHEERFFFPSQVGLTPLQRKWPDCPNTDDHIFHEMTRNDIKIVDEPPTTTMTAKELVARFDELEAWDEGEALDELYGNNPWLTWR